MGQLAAYLTSSTVLVSALFLSAAVILATSSKADPKSRHEITADLSCVPEGGFHLRAANITLVHSDGEVVEDVGPLRLVRGNCETLRTRNTSAALVFVNASGGRRLVWRAEFVRRRGTSPGSAAKWDFGAMALEDNGFVFPAKSMQPWRGSGGEGESGNNSGVEFLFELEFPDGRIYTDRLRVANLLVAPFVKEGTAPTERGMCGEGNKGREGAFSLQTTPTLLPSLPHHRTLIHQLGRHLQPTHRPSLVPPHRRIADSLDF
jgi:hypothetical protein